MSMPERHLKPVGFECHKFEQDGIQMLLRHHASRVKVESEGFKTQILVIKPRWLCTGIIEKK